METSELPSHVPAMSSPLPPFVPNRDGVTTPEAVDLSLMAPPASSGTDDEGGLWPDLQTLARRRRRLSLVAPTGIRAGDQSDASSPPSLTHSPVAPPNTKPAGAAKGRTTRRHPLPKAKSPKLASLLSKGRPQKRRGSGKAGHEEHGAQEDDAVGLMTLHPDDDELSCVGTRPRRTTRRVVGSKDPSDNSRALGKNKLAGDATQVEETANAKRRRISKTYGARRPSDKENEDDTIGSDDDDGDISRTDVVARDAQSHHAGNLGENSTIWKEGDELKKAVRKFEEVDKWELNFQESVGSSSPPDAR